MDSIYVFGHRNPDTDSIVSAMAYAALQNALGRREYVAARLGHISDETQLVLDHFGFEPPLYLKDVRTQVCDLDFDTPPVLNDAVTISRAWQVMQEHHISSLPVTDESGVFSGLLTSGDITKYDMDSDYQPWVSEVPVFNLLSVLEGQILNDSVHTPYSISGEITVALPQRQKNLLFNKKKTIVVCGDQPDMVRRALEIGVSCLIICQAELSPELRSIETDTCIISTPFDAYRALNLISLAIPIDRVGSPREQITFFRLTDYIDDVRETVLDHRFHSYPILDAEDHVAGMLSRYHLLRPRRKRVVLVDHNESAQSVEGLEQAQILGIIDHHRLADIQTGAPIYFRNEPVGSTTTIVAEMYQEKGLMPSEKLAGLMTAAILSDTVLFKSPTCTERDRRMAERLARIGNVHIGELGKLIFSSSYSSDRSAENLLMTDFKEFHIAGHNLGVSQVTTVDSDALLARKAEFLDAMRKMGEERGYDLVILMLTDVLKEGTELLYLGDTEIIRQAFSMEPKDSCVFLPKVMSRKKQVIPMLSALWG
ncbi:MAG: putative manganese-dependent inorganic diphosphatase [Oscillospiraceae bacterium]